MVRLLRWLLVGCVLMMGLPLAGDDALAQPGFTPVFDTAPCPFPVPEGYTEGENLSCGYVTAPERHANPTGPTIQLALAIFHHPSGNPEPDPLVFITGGPGGQSLALYTQDFNLAFGAAFAANRDIILYDQRGVGASVPALDCPVFSEVYLDVMDYQLADGERLSNEAILDAKIAALAECATNLSEVADLSAYNTTENAADLSDMRAALRDTFGYTDLNLWGSSYGSWVALEAMRSQPEGLRSVILDAPVPPEANLYYEMPESYILSLDTLFTWCAEDEACAAAYPDLEGTYYATIEALNTDPILTDVIHPYTGERYPVLMTGDMFAETIFRALYLTPLLPAMPKIILDAQDGAFDLLLQVVRQDVMRQDWRSWGMYISVMCHDEYPFNDRATFEDIINPYPALAGMFTDFEVGGLPFEGCPVWGVEAADPVLSTPVSSDIPTLILTGELDPIVHPEYGSLAAENLPNSTLYVFTGVGHGGSSGGDCPMTILTSFVLDPTAPPDDACVADMARPPFVLPVDASVVFVPFEDETLALQGVAPEGWQNPQPGTFIRAGSELDNTALLMQPIPLPLEAFPGFIQQNFSLETPPEMAAEYTANAQDWQLYTVEVQGMGVDFAVTGDEEGLLMVVLQTAVAERDALYESVFMPVVDALMPLE